MKFLRVFLYTMFWLLSFIFVALSLLRACPPFFGGYCYFCPHIDTRMAENFKPENFEKIETGMHIAEVEGILGKPLIFKTKPFTRQLESSAFISVYSLPGKSKIGEFAFQSFDVYFDEDTVVIGKVSKWWSDY